MPDEQPGGGNAEPAEQAPQGGAGELERLREESAQRLAGWQRAQADYENLKRRSARDVRDRVERSQRAIFDALIELADDFQRALNAPSGESSAADWREGVALIQQKLISLLERNSVYPIAAMGAAFDPHYHEAIGTLPGPEGEVLAELRRGWLIGDRVLRASQVMIGAEPQTEDNTEDPDNAAAAAPEASGGAAAEGD